MAGTGYTISFWLRNNGANANEFDLEWNGTMLYNQTDLPSFGYTQYTFNITGTGADTPTFSFRHPLSFFIPHSPDAAATLSALERVFG